jgi:hypothetical protein
MSSNKSIPTETMTVMSIQPLKLVSIPNIARDYPFR